MKGSRRFTFRSVIRDSWQILAGFFCNDLGPRCPSSYCVRSFAIRLNLFTCYRCRMSITCSRYFCRRRCRRSVPVRRTKNTNERRIHNVKGRRKKEEEKICADRMKLWMPTIDGSFLLALRNSTPASSSSSLYSHSYFVLHFILIWSNKK